MARKGKFIVIDGIDGVGKATQTELLVKRLKKEGRKVKKIDFPRYDANFFGGLIGECLRGEYGDFIAVHPKIASVLYAADRWESSGGIRKWLEAGYIVVADRYVSSNQIHQGGKVRDQRTREDFLKWLDTMEHKIFGIPRPDAIVYLHLPVVLSQALLRKMKEKGDAKKAYLRGAKDQAEENLKHMEESQESALSIIQKSNKWFRIECSKGEEILPKEDIHALVWEKVKKMV